MWISLWFWWCIADSAASSGAFRAVSSSVAAGASADVTSVGSESTSMASVLLKLWPYASDSSCNALLPALGMISC
jgi:hypothetical protein